MKLNFSVIAAAALVAITPQAEAMDGESSQHITKNTPLETDVHGKGCACSGCCSSIKE